MCVCVCRLVSIIMDLSAPSEKHFTLGKEAICWNRPAPFILSLITIQGGERREEWEGVGREWGGNVNRGKQFKKKKEESNVGEDGGV